MNLSKATAEGKHDADRDLCFKLKRFVLTQNIYLDSVGGNSQIFRLWAVLAKPVLRQRSFRSKHICYNDRITDVARGILKTALFHFRNLFHI